MTARRIAALLLPGGALALWLALGLAGIGATLPPQDRTALAARLLPLLQSHGALLLLWWAIGAGAGAWLAHRLHRMWVIPTLRMTDTTSAMIGAGSAPDIIPEGAASLRKLAEAINGLAAQRRTLSRTMAEQIRDGAARVAQQRDQLATLMAELAQSVIVCNAEGRILLYNDHARALSRSLSRAPGLARGAELVGLGRPIDALIDPGVIAHALDTVARRVGRGDNAVSARFAITTRSGHLLHVSLAPIRPVEAPGAAAGYVLLLEDATQQTEEQARREGLLLEFADVTRSAVAAMQAALEMLEMPDIPGPDRAQFEAVVRDEAGTLASCLDRLAQRTQQTAPAGWPLEDMPAGDFLSAASLSIARSTGRPPRTIGDRNLWLRLDSFSLIQGLTFISRQLSECLGPELDLCLAFSVEERHALLDLRWEGGEPPAEALRDWLARPLDSAALHRESVRDIVDRHGGSVWVARDGPDRPAFLRLWLPLAEAAEQPSGPEARPVYYDFDLFAASAARRALDDQPLSSLAYTVFDTETTGLDPVGGDEIIQIGAFRILNGRLLESEHLDQLVDPRRSLPEAGIAIHGIRPEMLRDQPTIESVLPAFYAFAKDTVLVGHNVGFDLRFLALKEASTGLRFDQPVLDTLLLASLVHPNAGTFSLEAIAGRLGLTIAGRHTALGDARATAEVFLAMLPLLEQRGIRTLGEARAAAQRSFHAHLRY